MSAIQHSGEVAASSSVFVAFVLVSVLCCLYLVEPLEVDDEVSEGLVATSASLLVTFLAIVFQAIGA